MAKAPVQPEPSLLLGVRQEDKVYKKEGAAYQKAKLPVQPGAAWGGSQGHKKEGGFISAAPCSTEELGYTGVVEAKFERGAMSTAYSTERRPATGMKGDQIWRERRPCWRPRSTRRKVNLSVTEGT